MSVDGPEIGTLVAIVDRAKNLPNRKTIGKQDPYCAARLGKEAKKTKTDIRGGQTPKWYVICRQYPWLSWTLTNLDHSCRDQELRFTVHDGPDYYQLKVSVFTDDKRTDLIGETWIDLKGIIVPGGGQADLWQQLTCRGKYAGDIRLEITYYDTRPKPEKPVAKARPQHAVTEQDMGSTKQRGPMKRRPLPSDPVTGEAPPVSPTDVAPVSAPAAAPTPSRPSSEQYQTPSRSHGKHPSQANFVSNQSPLQNVDYQTPPSGHRPRYQDQYSPSPQSHSHYQTPPRQEPQRQRQADPYDTPPRQFDDRDFASVSPSSPYHQSETRGQPRPEHHDLHFREDSMHSAPPMDGDRPPPPPVHRSRHNSGGLELAHKSSNSLDMSVNKASPGMSMRHDVLKNEAHRQSMSAYPGRPVFRAHDSAPSAMNSGIPYEGQTYEPPLPRHHSHDSVYDPHYRSMQATVEDVPDSPGEIGAYNESYRPRRHSRAYAEEPVYERDPSPAPLNLTRSREASPLHDTPSPMSTRETHENYGSYPPSGAYSTSPGRDAYHQPQNTQMQPPGYQDEWSLQSQRPSNYSLTELPPSLVPGMDPSLSQELAERIRDDRSYDRRQSNHNMIAPIRGRHLIESSSQSYDVVPVSASAGYNSQQYERHSPVPHAGGSEPRMRQHRDISPNPPVNTQHTIRRKSVSPAPPPSDQRRLSDIPFSPDSFDAFNTAHPSTRDARAIPDPDAKIITHDGKEIDPSDHLPVESWAPEPEAKQLKQAPEPRTRPIPSGAQPMPPSGRRQLRVAPRTQPPPPAAHPSYGPQEPHAPSAPLSAGRNRLQKRTNRGSEAHSLPGSGPLAPISSENYQERQGSYGANPRHNQWDYPNENYEPGRGSGPPIPAKVPLPVMSGANGSGHELALVHEMQRIDIGAGRSRRRGGY